MKKRIISLFLILVCLLSCFTSCGSVAREPVMTLGDSVVDTLLYRMWMTQYARTFLSYANEPAEEFWKAEAAEGIPMKDYVTEIAVSNIKKNLVCMYLFDEFGLTVTKEDEESIDSDLQDMIDSYGGKAKLNAALADYGVNADILREDYVIKLKIDRVYNYLLDNGMINPSNEDMEQYYESHYARIRYITLMLTKMETSEDGNVTSYGSMSEEETAAQKAKADELMAKLDAGADFEEMFDQYNEYDLTGYENGVYVSTDNAGYSIISAALGMEIGEILRVDQNSAIYVIHRLPLEKKPYLNDTMGQFTDLPDYVEDNCIQNLLTEYAAGITVDEALAAQYQVDELA